MGRAFSRSLKLKNSHIHPFIHPSSIHLFTYACTDAWVGTTICQAATMHAALRRENKWWLREGLLAPGEPEGLPRKSRWPFWGRLRLRTVPPHSIVQSSWHLAESCQQQNVSSPWKNVGSQKVEGERGLQSGRDGGCLLDDQVIDGNFMVNFLWMSMRQPGKPGSLASGFHWFSDFFSYVLSLAHLLPWLWWGLISFVDKALIAVPIAQRTLCVSYYCCWESAQ